MKLHSSDFVRFVQLKARGKKNHIPVWFDNNLKSLIYRSNEKIWIKGRLWAEN